MTSNYLFPPAARRTFIFIVLLYFLSKMNITWVTGHLEIYNILRFLECFTPHELKAWGQESQRQEVVYLFSACNSHCVLNWGVGGGSLLSELRQAVLPFKSHLRDKTALFLQTGEEGM